MDDAQHAIPAGTRAFGPGPAGQDGAVSIAFLIFTAHHIVCDGWSTNVLLTSCPGLQCDSLGSEWTCRPPMAFADHAARKSSSLIVAEGRKVRAILARPVPGPGFAARSAYRSAASGRQGVQGRDLSRENRRRNPITGSRQQAPAKNARCSSRCSQGSRFCSGV